MLEKLVARMHALTAELEISAGKHNSLVGAMNELKALYDDLVATAPVVESVVSDISPVDGAAIHAIEEVVDAVEAVI